MFVFRLIAKILSLMVFFLTIAAAYGGKVNPHFWAFPAVLTLALPYFGIATVLISIGWLLARRLLYCGLGVLTILAVAAPLSQACPLSFPKEPSSTDRTFTLLTFNSLHLRDSRRPDGPGNRAIDFLLATDADIVCLQELISFTPHEIPNLTDAMLDSLFARYPYRAGSGSTDLKVLSKFPVRVSPLRDIKKNGHTRFDIFELKVEGHTLHVVNCHLPSYSLTATEREVVTDIRSVGEAKNSLREFRGPIRTKLSDAFRERADTAALLRKYIDIIPGALIVCGDFNDVPESWAYRLIRGDDLHDAYTETNFGPTWTFNEHLFLFHIDQILYRGPLEAMSVKRQKINTSDHYPLLATFKWTNN